MFHCELYKLNLNRSFCCPLRRQRNSHRRAIYARRHCRISRAPANRAISSNARARRTFDKTRVVRACAKARPSFLRDSRVKRERLRDIRTSTNDSYERRTRSLVARASFSPYDAKKTSARLEMHGDTQFSIWSVARVATPLSVSLVCQARDIFQFPGDAYEAWGFTRIRGCQRGKSICDLELGKREQGNRRKETE